MKACVNCEAEDDACFDPEKNPALKSEIKLARRRHDPGQRHQARHPVRQPGLHGHRLPDLRHRLGFGSLSHRLRPELQQLRVASPTTFCARSRPIRDWHLTARKDGKVDQDAQGPRPVGADRPRRLGLRRSGPALQHHHERLAHLPGGRPHPRIQPLLGIHVPRRHGLQPRLANLLHFYDRDAKASTSTRYEHACRLWTVVLEISVTDGAVPLAGDRPALLRVPHARPRLRQYRRPADGHRASPTIPTQAARSAARSPPS